MSAARQRWAKHLAAIAAEGISTRAYARREGLAVGSLYFWRRRLKAAATGGSAVASHRFVAVQLAQVERRVPCVLTLAAGVRLELAELPAPSWVAALAAVVAESH